MKLAGFGSPICAYVAAWLESAPATINVHVERLRHLAHAAARAQAAALLIFDVPPRACPRARPCPPP